MINGQKGFTYPLTLMMLLLFLLYFSAKIEWLMAERKMEHEKMLILQEEYYYLSTVKKMENLYQSGGAAPAKGTFTFSNGSMYYQSENPIGTFQRINFTLTMASGEKCIAQGTFDTSSKKLTKWIELK